MIRIAISLAMVGVASMATLPANALLSRAWVSGKGVDAASCGPIERPCRSLQYTHDTIIAPGGEIDVLDSAGYGSLTIDKALNVVNDGNVAGVLAPAGSNGITINAGANDDILLRGLTVEGASVGRNGIVFNTGRNLVISKCFVQNFSGTGADGNGIVIQPAGSTTTHAITIDETTAVNNQYSGVTLFTPPASTLMLLSIDRLRANQNGRGVHAFVQGQAFHRMAISNSVLANNVTNGIDIATKSSSDGILLTYIDLTEVTGNGNGIVIGTSTPATETFLRRSTIWGNTNVGIDNPSGTTVWSYGDNSVFRNFTRDVTDPPKPISLR